MGWDESSENLRGGPSREWRGWLEEFRGGGVGYCFGGDGGGERVGEGRGGDAMR